MSLSISLQNALSGLKVSQQSFGVLSQNIANANNENYTRQQISQSSRNLGSIFGAGVYIEGVTRVVDNFISTSIITRNADVSKAGAVKSYYEKAQLYLGQPGRQNSIDSYVNNFFSSLSNLSITPERTSVKLNTVNAAVTLTQEISSLALNLEDLRFQADKEISLSVRTVNFELKNLYELNRAIVSAEQNGNNVNTLMDKMMVSLKKISDEIDINYQIKGNNTVSVSTKSGVALLEINLFELEYNGATSLAELVGDVAHKGITIHALDSTGNRTGDLTPLVSGGHSDEVSTRLTGGKIKGLLEVRDKIIPDMLKQLDNMASTLRDQINSLHNAGSGYPPKSKLAGTTFITPSQAQNWEGSVMIAVMDEFGIPYASPYASESAAGTGYAPLTLNLSQLDTGNGAGKPSYQGIIDEINRYYGVPKPRTNFTSATADKPILTDMKIAAISDSLDGGAGTFSFDFDFSNLTGNNASVVITGSTVNSGNATIDSPTAFPTTGYNVVAGDVGNRSGGNLQFDLDITGAGAVSISFDVQITDSEGNISTSTITYEIPEAEAGMRNDRFEATAIAGDAQTETPLTTQRFAAAKLVDANGLEIPKDPVTGDYLYGGYLVIEGNNQSYRIAIDSLDSKHMGDLPNGIPASNRGFTHYFGLNNFFEDNGETKNAALDFKVKQSIIDEPQAISTGVLSRSSQPTAEGAYPRYTYSLSAGSNKIADQMAELGLTPIRFAAAGSIPELSLSFSDYAAEIIGFISSATTQAIADYDQQNLIYGGFVEKDTNTRGVNIDEEMANTIIFQNAYSANARVITTINEMFKSLIDAF